MSEREHTPTPWMTDNVDVFSGEMRGPKKVKVCRLSNSSLDGEFIVTACNSHEALVAALDRAVNYVAAHCVFHPQDEKAADLLHECTNILSLAKGDGT